MGATDLAMSNIFCITSNGTICLLSYLFFFRPTPCETVSREHLHTQLHDSSTLQKIILNSVYCVHQYMLGGDGGFACIDIEAGGGVGVEFECT